MLTTIVVTAAVCLAGWRLIDQQRDIDEQQVQRQLSATAAEMAAGMRSKLAETGERLSAAVANPDAPPAMPGAAILTVRPDGSAIATNGGLPFVPAVPDSSAVDAMFVEGEALEFSRTDLVGAAIRYQRFASHRDPAIRAGAVLRLARVALKRGDRLEALQRYQQLEQLGNVRVTHLPARFVALYQQRELTSTDGDDERKQQLTSTLTAGLDAGAWVLARRDAAFYRDQLGMPNVPPAWPLAEAIDAAWQATGRGMANRGQRVFDSGPRNVLVMWRAGGSVSAMMAAFVDEFLPPAPHQAIWHLADPAGRWIAGARSIPPGAASPHLVGDAEAPWMLHVGSVAVSGVTRGSERTLIATMAAMLIFLWGAMYFMVRAIRRESAVARLQSDFVAAVSHEFRSPLTTIRQMAEMLEMGRVASDERRQAYYGVLAGEASRLQRLVETLLNFGRMEAGVAQYRLQDVELGDLLRRVVNDNEQAARESGKRIIVSGTEAAVFVRADANALALAIRNLIDNAVKYSPHQPEIRVEWGQVGDRAAIRVVDRGIGIPRDEQQMIFEKFVRGRSAIDANVGGTGVGLAIVQQILRAHGGEIDVRSEVGQGSTFTLMLPAANCQPSTPGSQLVAEATEARL